MALDPVNEASKGLTDPLSSFTVSIGPGVTNAPLPHTNAAPFFGYIGAWKVTAYALKYKEYICAGLGMLRWKR